MNFLKNVLSFSLFFFSLACTNKTQSEFQWKGLVNLGVTDIKIETKKPMISESEILAGQSEKGLRLRVIKHLGGAEQFDELFTRIAFLLKSIYQDQEAPYPGQITKIISCPENFRPRPLAESNDSIAKRKGFLLMANSREVFGACDATSVRFHALHALVLCKTKNILFEIKLFQPAGEKSMEELKNIYEGFSCN